MRKLIAVALAAVVFNSACRPAGNANNANLNSNANGNASTGAARAGRSDAWITFKLKLALLANNPTSGYETEVDTRDGIVTLTGKVDTNDAKTSIEEVARKVEGVKSVNNQIQVVDDAKRKEVNASDDKIKDEIATAMDSDGKLNDLALAIDSNAGVVSLDGTVDTQEQLLYAAQAIRKIPGVKSVVTSAVTVSEDKNP